MSGETAVQDAPGHPGIEPRWTSSDKAGVGTALSALSRVWFTISHGILNEVYYPRVDQACMRDFGLLVSDSAGYFSEEKRDCHHRVASLEDGVPAFRLTNTAIDGRYRIVKSIVSDTKRDVVLQSIRFQNLSTGKLRLFALLAPHLVNGGAHNTGWVGEYKGQEMLFAEGDGTTIALGASVPWLARSAGFVGASDGWSEINNTGGLKTCYGRAEDGNVALTGELDVDAGGDGEILLALGFGRYSAEAALRARLSLAEGFDNIARGYVEAWRSWQHSLLPFDRIAANQRNTYRISTAVLRSHESPSFPGAFIASLSIPWGFNKGDDDLGGYHLVWCRDLVQTAGALIACGAGNEAHRVLEYLRAIQDPDGRWPQNTWLDGVPYWRGVQIDECAFPILLIDLARRDGVLTADHLPAFWPMVRSAAGFVMRHGPITGQDRWEEDAGFSPFTLAVAVAALLVAAELADFLAITDQGRFIRDTADAWNESIESWTFATGTDLANFAGVDGYYVRIAPPAGLSAQLEIKNRGVENTFHPAAEVISPDALALVRFGLRSADDPRILSTVRAIDACLRIELPAGPCWYRYSGDGYGEHEDGRPFDGTGIGRAWPLLTGERAHYELALGNMTEAARLLTTMEALTSQGGLFPEQVWDADDIPERELFRGRPSGSAMPLVWAHSEHIKLIRSLTQERVFDMPPQTVQRYQHERVSARCAVWRKDLATAEVPAGKVLRIDLAEPSRVRWTDDDWSSFTDTETTDCGLGLHFVELPTAGKAPGTRLYFTWQQLEHGSWEGQNHAVAVVAPDKQCDGGRPPA
jgi:glucoamylase